MKIIDMPFHASLAAMLLLSACSGEPAQPETNASSAPAAVPAAPVAAQPAAPAFTNTVTESDTATIPPTVAARLLEIGAGNDLPGTAALYTPDFEGEFMAGMNVARDIAYGPAERNLLDVVTAKDMAPGRPVLIFVHGGGFGAGNKSSATSPFYDNISFWAASNDLVGVNVNYRYAPASQWPAGIEDLSQVVSWIKANIAEYGGDPDRIFFWGKSTGASHVADYMADRVRNGQPAEIAGAIFTSGSYALGDTPLWANYYGDDVALYAERNTLPLLVQTETPLLATYGEFDGEQYKEQFNLLLAAMNDAGKPLETLYLRNHSHMSETYAVGTADTSLTGPVLDFIVRTSGEK